MKKMMLSCLTFLSLAAAGVSAHAETLVLDSAHSNINFEVGHLMSTVTGRFDVFSAKGEIDLAQLEKSALSVKIDTKSVYTGVSQRDQHLRTPDFFNVEKYPEATFKSVRIDKIEGNKYKMLGELTIKETTRPVVLDFEFLGSDKDQFGNLKSGFVAKTSFKRSDFGITFNALGKAGTLLISDDVKLTINGEWMSPAAP